MQPITPMMRSGRSRLRRLSAPSCENTFSSAFSRIAQVFSEDEVGLVGRVGELVALVTRSPATRSESYSFIWQPYVIRWSLDINYWHLR